MMREYKELGDDRDSRGTDITVCSEIACQPAVQIAGKLGEVR
jgi:hypothetical protein